MVQYKSNDQMDKSFLDASIPELIKKLSVDEKISLLAGQDFWRTVPVPRLNIPSIKVTDGPNGARGDSFFQMTPASALPCATCLGSTFSTSLIEQGGQLLGEETKARNAVCLLAPTINIQRSPLGGRAFESFSEDPTLSGTMAAAYVKGLQSRDISATIKHFVGNDQEHERMGSDSVMSQRALREIYLRPFQIAQARSIPWAYMTSYSKLNGTHASENKWLLQDLLRKEWEHKGLIMSDWYGTYSVSESINAGLDLEMPGPTRWRTSGLVNHLLNAHKIDPIQIDKLATQVLTWVQKLAKLHPDIVYAKPTPERTRTEARESDAKLLRQIGGEGIVLLKNEDNVLPITKSSSTKKVAVIGPNARAKVLTGGGSASLRCAWSYTPMEGLEVNKPEGVELSYSLGAVTSKFLPTLDENFTTIDGKAGFNLRQYPISEDGKQNAKALVDEVYDNSDMFMGDYSRPGLGEKFFSEIEALFTSPIDGEYQLSVCATGQGWVWFEDKLILDTKGQEKGSSFFGTGTAEKIAKVSVQKGKQYRIRALHDCRAPQSDDGDTASPFNMNGLRVGAGPVVDPDQAIKEAVELAKQSDVAVLVCGLNADWESEGYDRPDLSIPGRSNDLISAVAEANPNTIVVLQGGSAMSLPWIDKVKGLVYTWYLGNECGNAIADVIYGKINPSGRLSLSLPKREIDIAAHLNNKSARTKVHYHEDIWVGYKHHNANGIAPAYPFGHGLSYTTFEYSDLKITSMPKKGTAVNDWKLKASVNVKNTGDKEGHHSVHFYTCPPAETDAGLKHPQWSLQAFDKIYNLAPGASKTVEVTLDKYAISHWDELWDTWRVEQGEWKVKVGKDAQTMFGDAAFTIEDELQWRGL